MFRFVALFALVVISLWGCKEEINKTGYDLLLPGDLVSASKDTVFVSKSYSVTDEKLRTNKPEYNLLGTLNDPVFGKTTADFACQFRMNDYIDYSKVTFDSLILTIRYYELYGDRVTPQVLKVYELNSDLDADAIYYQDEDLKSLAKGEVVAELNYVPKLKLDSLSNRYGSTKKIPKDTAIQDIVFRLNNALAQKLMAFKAPAVIPPNYNPNDDFLAYFKGLYIEAGDLSQGGGMMRINTLDADSEMKLHYHDAKDTTFVRYRINSNTARTNRFVHDYSTARFTGNLDNPDQPDSLIYLQTTGGLSAKILIPDLSTWKGSTNYVINKAELVFQVEQSLTDTVMYPAPKTLKLSLMDKDGGILNEKGELISPSDLAFSVDYYGGTYNKSDGTYRFNLAKHMQDIIKGSKENFGFYLSTADKNSNFTRVVLKGATSKAGIRFDVTYSKLN